MAGQWLHTWAIKDPSTGKFVWTNDDGSPAWEFPNRSGIVLLTTSDDPYLRKVEHFNKILAAGAALVRSNEDLSAAKPITFTIDAQPDVPRNLTWAFDSHAQITAFTITFTGKDAKGNTITDVITEASGWSGATAKAYATITSIIMSVRTGTGAGDTMDIGLGSILGLSSDVAAAGDVYKVTKSVAAGNAGDYPAASFTVNATNDTVDVSTGGAIADGDAFTIWYKSRMLAM